MTDTTALQVLLNADDAEMLYIIYTETGDCCSITTLNAQDEEVYVYEGHDLTPAARFAANSWPWRPVTYPGEIFLGNVGPWMKCGALYYNPEEGYIPVDGVPISAMRIRMLNHPAEFEDA